MTYIPRQSSLARPLMWLGDATRWAERVVAGRSVVENGAWLPFTPDFALPWIDYGLLNPLGPTAEAGMMASEEGYVHLRGMVAAGSVEPTPPSLIFSIDDPGYWPQDDVYLPTLWQGGGAPRKIAVVHVSAWDGSINYFGRESGVLGGDPYMFLDGLYWRAAE